MPRIHRWFVLALVAAFAVTAAACGSSNDSSSGGTGSSTATTAVNTKVIKIGVIAPLDAGLTEFGHGILNSVQLAVDQANASNAIPGYTIEVEARDDSSDAAKGKQAAEELAADPQVVGVVGPYNSGVAAEVAPVLSSSGVVLISPSNTNPTLTLGSNPAAPSRPYDTYFRMVGSDIAQADFLATDAFQKLGFATVAVVSETKPVSKGLADNFSTDFTRLGGQVAVTQVVPDDADSFTDFINAAKAANPQFIFFGGEYKVAAKLRDQATTAGLTVPIMGGDGMKDNAYITDGGPPTVGDYASSVGTPADSAASAKSFLEAYRAANYTEPPTDYGPYAYDAANLIISGAAQNLGNGDSGGVTPALRRAVVASVQATDTTGASGKIGFDDFGDTKYPVFTLYTVKDDAGTLVWHTVDATG